MKDFPELSQILNLIERAPSGVKVEELATVEGRGKSFPIHAFHIGSSDRSKPAFGLFAGVHGLERIGTQAVLAFLESLFEQMRWDDDLNARLRNVRLLTVPLINPGGMYFYRRSNLNGVDLMRNSPVEALVKPKALIGGHRLSPRLPYYRGPVGKGMELESQVVVDFVKRELFPSQAAMVLDVHSGFGLKDRLWYPYAKTTEEFPRLKEVVAFEKLLSRTYPYHIYSVEPQSLSYTTHGDLWDYLFDEHQALHGAGGPLFIPWTLEMGSWLWVKKNPLQFFSSMGIFNPVKIHRKRRALRRHLALMDLFLRATQNHRNWLPGPRSALALP